MIKHLVKKLFYCLSKCETYDAKHYWAKRVEKYGRRAVLNIGHSEEEYDQVTKYQQQIILPFLKEQLKGDETILLDYGCGAGRFTTALAETVNGYAIGADPIKQLIDLAPKNQLVDYMLIESGVIPIDSKSIDVIWICLVLGGITCDLELKQIVNEFYRVLKTDGLIFLIENTSEAKDSDYWKYRSVADYKKIFCEIDMQYVTGYSDLGESITVLCGRKHV